MRAPFHRIFTVSSSAQISDRMVPAFKEEPTIAAGVTESESNSAFWAGKSCGKFWNQAKFSRRSSKFSETQNEPADRNRLDKFDRVSKYGVCGSRNHRVKD